MHVVPRAALMAMKVTELKEELEARGEGKTGNKAWLRRRLYAAIVRHYLDERAGDAAESDGEGVRRAHMNGLHSAIFGERGEWDESQ